MELYQWQTDCLTAWEKNRYRGIINVITGAGKTVLALAAMEKLLARYPDLRVRIVVPTLPLAGQWKQALLRRAKEEADLPGFFSGMRKDETDRRFTVYVVNSARIAMNRHIRSDLASGRHVLLICDECHHYQSPENRKIFDFLTPSLRDSAYYSSLGLSATPFSSEEDAAFLQEALGREIYRYGFRQAERDGVISAFTVCHVATGFCEEERLAYEELSERLSLVMLRLRKQHPELTDLTEQEFFKRVTALAAKAEYDPSDPASAFMLLCYQRKEISVLAKARAQCCLALLERLSAEDRILIFCERIDQAEQATRAIRKRFGACSCGIYHSRMSRDARARNMALFQNGSIKILVSCRCLDEGIDVPEANIGIVLSSSAVTRQRTQRLGRVIRRAEHKDAACLYYIFIRESAEPCNYMSELDERQCFDLRYYPAEDEFSNELYEYAAGELLAAAEGAEIPQRCRKELRRCLLAGMTRADYLLNCDVQRRNAETAETTRERNYWHTMQRIGKYYQPQQAEEIAP